VTLIEASGFTRCGLRAGKRTKIPLLDDENMFACCDETHNTF